jgi:phosphoglycerate dehydrogenase-like enzyme
MEFVKLQKLGFIGLGNVGGKLAGSLIRNGCDLVLRDIGLFQDIATAHNVPLEI